VIERANFKAEASAIQDLANECSFVPRGARTEDRAEQPIGAIHRAFAKVAISFQDCEEAKSSNDPETIRKLANVSYAEELKRYQAVVDQPEDTTSDESVAGAGGAIYNRYPPPASIDSPVRFYVVRQQVVYMKQDIILSPPQAYPPKAPQTLAITQHLGTFATRVQNFETIHPALKTATQSYSSVRPSIRSSNHAQRFRANPHGSNPRFNPNPRGGGEPGNPGKPAKRRRRRRNRMFE